MSRALRVVCRVCGERAVILKSDRQTLDFNRLYCQCKNPDCGHRFVVDLTFSHTTHESRLTRKGIVDYLLESLPKHELTALKNQILAAEQKQLNF